MFSYFKPKKVRAPLISYIKRSQMLSSSLQLTATVFCPSQFVLQNFLKSAAKDFGTAKWPAQISFQSKTSNPQLLFLDLSDLKLTQYDNFPPRFLTKEGFDCGAISFPVLSYFPCLNSKPVPAFYLQASVFLSRLPLFTQFLPSYLSQLNSDLWFWLCMYKTLHFSLITPGVSMQSPLVACSFHLLSF